MIDNTPEVFDSKELKQIVSDINAQNEQARRQNALKRHSIYRDGAKEYLIEQLTREFSAESMKEMRLAPINLLKKIISKLSTSYKRPPNRTVEDEKTKALVDFYVKALKLDEHMQRANRYYSLHSNTGIYCVPVANRQGGSLPQLTVLPPHLYSLVPNDYDQSMIDAWVLSAFAGADYGTPTKNLGSATGVSGWATSPTAGHSEIADNSQSDKYGACAHIFWSDAQHLTLDEQGNPITMVGNEQGINPIGRYPIVNLAKERDNETWASQGEDLVDLTIAVQLGFSDLLTIAKHQGYSILTVSSKEEPSSMTVGINKAIWLKQENEGPQPSVSYATAQSPIDQYRQLLMELVGLMLSTNNLNPKEIGGADSARSFTSGFQALIESADTLEAREMDEPVLRSAEQELWQVVALWHNYLFDTRQLAPQAAALGKFEDPYFDISITYSKTKPIEDEAQVLASIKTQTELGLMSEKDAIKRLYPDLSDEQIAQKLQEIADEKAARVAAFAPPASPVVDQPDNNGDVNGSAG